MFTGSAGKQTVIGVFVLNADAAAAQATLEVAGFTPTPIPEYEGSLVMRMGEIDAEKNDLLAEQESLNSVLKLGSIQMQIHFTRVWNCWSEIKNWPLRQSESQPLTTHSLSMDGLRWLRLTK